MRILKRKKNKGFMLIQLVIGIVVIGILSSVVALSLTENLHQQALDNSVDEVSALINEARSRTVAGDQGVAYGVHLEATQAVLFSGATYTPGDTSNWTVTLDRSIQIDSITLNGGGSEILFERLYGDTANDGTFIVKTLTGKYREKTVTVTKVGAVSSS
jgi:Tfp pilus assembly protein FimT